MQILTFSVSPVYYMRYCDSLVRFCAVFAQSKNLFWDCENTAQNLTGESQYRIVCTGEKENVRICIIKRKYLHIWNSVSTQMLIQQNKQLILFF